MKKTILFVIFVLFLTSFVWGQTTLSAGDIAILGANSDNPDDFAFLLLVDIEAGTEIRFTDSGWLSINAFQGDEGAQKYTSPTAITAGTVITYSGNSTDFIDDGDASVGNDGINLSYWGDQVFAFQGVSTSPTFIYAMQFNSNVWQSDATSENDSALPQGLTDGTNAVATGAGSGASDEYDNVIYNGSTNFSNPAATLSSISNNSNWIGNNATRYDFSTFGDFILPVNLSSFYAIYLGGTPTLYWTTQSEESNDYWNVYRSSSDNFTEAALLNGADPVPGNGTTNNASDYIYVDTAPILQNTTYWYWIEDVSTDGETEIHEPITLTIPYEDAPITPDFYGLQQNYPNPFNPSTSISFTLEEESDVQLIIYNVKGEKIKSVFSGHIYADEIGSAVWAGDDENGKQVSSGVYLYKLITDTKEYSKKMLLVK
ncbi:MAG: T9SS type A sorting domain-containing protein [Candidatus Tenebribacter davisii]|nr:T9SS type A sorting domain-containing protein [Candidatus Tenebribacter davisii]